MERFQRRQFVSILVFCISLSSSCKTVSSRSMVKTGEAGSLVPRAPTPEDIATYGAPDSAIQASSTGNSWSDEWEKYANATQALNTLFFKSNCENATAPTCDTSLRMFASSYTGNSHCAPDATKAETEAEYNSMTGFTLDALNSAFGSTAEYGEDPNLIAWVCWHFTAKALERRGIMTGMQYISHTKSLRGYLCSEALKQSDLDQIGLPTIDESPAIYSYFREVKDPDVGKGNCGNQVQTLNRHSTIIVHKDTGNPENSIVAQINGRACTSGIVFSRLRDLRSSNLGAPDAGGTIVYSKPDPQVLIPPDAKRVYLPIINNATPAAQ